MGSRKPSTYFYRTGHFDREMDEWEAVDHEARTYKEAKREAVAAHSEGYYAAIGRRSNIIDVTPEDDPPGLLWDYGQEIIEEI